MRAEPFLETYDKHDVELEPLSRMQGDQGDGIARAVVLISVGRQGGILEERREAALGSVDGELLGDSDQLTDIIQPRLALLGSIIKELAISGELEDALEEACHNHLRTRPAQYAQEPSKLHQRGPGPCANGATSRPIVILH